MTIGPAPMMRMDLISLRLGISCLLFFLFHQPGEAVEEIADVMRTRTRFRVTLETKGGTVSARKPLEGTVEERNVRRAQVGADRRRIDGEAVVLAGDHHLAGVE